MVFEGNYNGSNKKIAIVCSRFNELITKKLLDGAIDALVRHQVSVVDLDIFWVPGAFEIPLITKKVVSLKKHSAIITLGAVIKGSTPHFDYVSSEVAKGIAALSLNSDVPIVFGVLTTNNIEEAIERAGTKSGNRGFDAALSALELANLFESF